MARASGTGIGMEFTAKGREDNFEPRESMSERREDEPGRCGRKSGDAPHSQAHR